MNKDIFVPNTETEIDLATDAPTDNKVNYILKGLNYDDIDELKIMLDMTIRRLKDKEDELLLYKKKCIAYEKALNIRDLEIQDLHQQLKNNFFTNYK